MNDMKKFLYSVINLAGRPISFSCESGANWMVRSHVFEGVWSDGSIDAPSTFTSSTF
jgi:hypothetical protein